MRAPLGCVVSSLVVFLVSACADDERPAAPPTTPMPDAGNLAPLPPPPDVVAEPIPPAAPEIPWLEAGEPEVAPTAIAALAPCGGGWRPVESATGVAYCEPWPEAGHAACAAVDEAHLPADDGCRRIGSACPAGDFATDMPAGATVVYVRPGASAGGDGTMASPFATIEEAILASPQRAIIALAKGTHREGVRLNGGRVLWGACVAETVIAVSGASTTGDGVVTVSGRDVGIRNLRIGRSGRIGILVRGSASASIEDVVVERTAIAGILATDGASVSVTRSVVRDVGLDTATTGDRGVHVQMGASAELSRVVIDGTVGRAISVATEGSTVRATDVAVVRTAKPPRSFADSILAALGGSVSLSRVVVEDADTNAIRAEGTGSLVVATDVLVRGVGVSDRTELDAAVTSLMGGRVELSRAAVLGFGEIGIAAVDEGSSTSLTDVLVSGAGSDGSVLGTGVFVALAATMNASRVVVEHVRDFAIAADQPGTRFDASDLVVRDVVRTDDPAMGTIGVQLTAGAASVIERATIERVAEEAAVAHGEGTTLELRDLRVVTADALLSSALRADTNASMVVERAVIEDARNAGVTAANAATLRGTDLVIRRCRQTPEGLFGVGLEASFGSTMTLSRVLVHDCADAAIVAGTAGTRLELADAVVRDMRARESDGRGGHGVIVISDATARVERVLMERTSGGAFEVAYAARAELFDLSVHDTRANVADGFGGWAVAAENGGELVGERVLALRSRQAGVVAYGGTLTLSDLRVEDTLGTVCDDSVCAGALNGFGIVSLASGRATIARFAVATAALCGTMVASAPDGAEAPNPTGNGELDLADGTVAHAPVGACVQVEGYSIDRLAQNVRYVDNGTNLQATQYPPPSPTAITPR